MFSVDEDGCAGDGVLVGSKRRLKRKGIMFYVLRFMDYVRSKHEIKDEGLGSKDEPKAFVA